MAQGYYRNCDRHRGEANISVAELARGSGIDPASVRRMISGSAPSRDTTVRSAINYFNKTHGMSLVFDDEFSE